jgi:K+-transporting ATPase ATPase C chain
MGTHLRANLWLLGLTVLLCSVLYPLSLWGVGQALFKEKAEGSLLKGTDDKVVGSRLIAQPFGGDGYFQPRPSAASYNASASGASNWGASNPKLRFRVARALGPVVRYGGDPRNGDRRGQPVGPFVEKWFAEKDRLAGWANDNPTLAAEWVKTDDNSKKTVTDWIKEHPQIVDAWKKQNPDAAKAPDPETAPEEYAVQFFAGFAAAHPRGFPALVDDGKGEKRVGSVTEGSDIQGVFFDAWLRDPEHADADLEKVPADMVTASGSGLDPHITLRNAKYQSPRVVEARTKEVVEELTKNGGTVAPARQEAIEKAVRDAVEGVLQANASVPLGGLIGGEPLVNVLEVNLALDAAMKKVATR